MCLLDFNNIFKPLFPGINPNHKVYNHKQNESGKPPSRLVFRFRTYKKYINLPDSDEFSKWSCIIIDIHVV